MKKNLRIVSAAAAALLAVAPVAAGVVPAANTVVSAASTDYTANHPFRSVVKMSTREFYQGNERGDALTWHDLATTYGNEMLPSTLTATTSNGEAIHLLANHPTDALVNGKAANELDPSSDQAGATYGQKLVKLGDTYIVSRTYKIGGNTEAVNHQLANRTLKINGQEISFDSEGQSVVRVVRVIEVGDKTATKPTKPADTASDSINAGSSSIFANEANAMVNITATAKTKAAPSAVNGNIVVTLDGKSYTAMLHNDANGINTKIYTFKKGTPVAANDLTAGHYWAVFSNVSLNLGNSYANKTVKLTLNRGGFSFKTANGATASSATKEFTANANGVVDLGTVAADFYALNPNDAQGVHFYDVATGNVVTSGTASMHAVNGKLSVQSVFAALTKKYVASKLTNGQGVETLIPVNDIKAQLEKAGIKVDANGYFTAPASFNINMNAKSNDNGATASLPVTVNVDNVAPTAANETTTTKTIMHIATIYDKNGVATHEPVLRAYNSVEVVAEPVTLKDSKGKEAGKFYKLAGKDQYIKVGNIDGTSRTLKKNAVIYKSTGKPYMRTKKHRKIVKAGSTHTTYGKSFMIAGHQMYRVGRNQYIKKANF